MYQRKVLIKTLSDHEGQGQLKYDDNAYAKFGRNDYLNQNIAKVHEENKQFKCEDGIFKGYFSPKLVLQMSHLNCFFSSWTVSTCLLKVTFSTKLALQI